jgi:hypothetical protein
MKGDANEAGNETKGRKLQVFEDEATREEDPARLSELFEKYRMEYLNDRDDGDNDGSKRWKTRETCGGELQEVASGYDQPATYEAMRIGSIETAQSWSSIGCERVKIHVKLEKP